VILGAEFVKAQAGFDATIAVPDFPEIQGKIPRSAYEVARLSSAKA
jgi:hypothetical protein